VEHAWESDGGLTVIETAFATLPLKERPLRASTILRQLRDRLGGRTLLRWGVVAHDSRGITCEIATARLARSPPEPEPAPDPRTSRSERPVAIVIPTGIGARVGGFIGDAGPIVQAFEEVCDAVVTHPNVVNGAGLLGLRRSYYTDGFLLDRFFEGTSCLGLPVHGPIGVVLDQLDDRERARALNAVHAARAVAGVDLGPIVTTADPVRACVVKTDYGHFIGRVENPETLLSAADRARSVGARALAVVTQIDGVSPHDIAEHYGGHGPNPVGAVEALISRYITAATGLPCAHAPAYGDILGGAEGQIVDPRAASEAITRSGLPSVLMGLRFAPRAMCHDGIDVRNLTAIVVPAGCGGGAATLAAELHGIPLIEVRMNHCCIDVPHELFACPRRLVAETYAEALGLYVALRAGIHPQRLVDDGSAPLAIG
jgi:hypothetical protein